MRRFWHPECVVAHNIAHRSATQRRALSKRDHWWCAGCGQQCNVYPDYRAWEADHIVPLWSVPDGIDIKDRDRFWGISNLQTLCGECHRRKSAREADIRKTQRARITAEAPLFGSVAP
jgi:5-methylcytosine-specific restriction endonuclease McrA